MKDYETPREAMQGLATFFVRYNEWRQHQSLDYRTPAVVYFNSYLWYASDINGGVQRQFFGGFVRSKPFVDFGLAVFDPVDKYF